MYVKSAVVTAVADKTSGFSIIIFQNGKFRRRTWSMK